MYLVIIRDVAMPIIVLIMVPVMLEGMLEVMEQAMAVKEGIEVIRVDIIVLIIGLDMALAMALAMALDMVLIIIDDDHSFYISYLYETKVSISLYTYNLTFIYKTFMGTRSSKSLPTKKVLIV